MTNTDQNQTETCIDKREAELPEGVERMHAGREFRPFLLSFGVFLMGYLGIAISTWPYIVPFEITFRQAAAAPESQSLLLVGTIIMLPVVLAYVGFCYYLFRGKASHESLY